MNKPFWKSFTLVGGLIFTVSQWAESQQLVPPGTATSVNNLIQAISGMLTIFGLRRAVG